MAQLGADGADPRVQAGCEVLLSHCIAGNGGLSWNGTPSGFEQCMAGLMGAEVIVAGLQDAVIETLVELGMTLENIQAVLDLDDALAWSRIEQQAAGPWAGDQADGSILPEPDLVEV